MVSPEDVLSYWFGDIQASSYPEERFALWWQKNPDTDTDIRERFADTLAAAGRGELNDWKTTPRGLMAYIILLDQFSRNMYRDTPKMYTMDDEAADAALQGLIAHFASALTFNERSFFYMPFMHAENKALQRLCVRLFEKEDQHARPADKKATNTIVDYAHQHAKIVERFGRFPHRNTILGRTSTPEELAFLEEPGSSF